jgi:hypothetical protein
MIFEYTKDFSKEYKYTLGQDMNEKGCFKVNYQQEKDNEIH